MTVLRLVAVLQLVVVDVQSCIRARQFRQPRFDFFCNRFTSVNADMPLLLELLQLLFALC